MFKRLLAALAVASFALCVHADVPVPVLKSRVTDLTGTLSAEQKGSLEQRLAAFEAQKGSQIAVLMLPTTRPEEIEQYSIRVAEAWKIGRKGTDDGVLVIIAKDDRRLRIEVGYGLEGAIPDATAKRVISETITPRFKAGDFYGGVSAGVDQLIRLVEGERLPPPSAATGGSSSGASSDFGSLMEMVIGAFFIVLAGGAFLRTKVGRLPAALLAGVIAAVVLWLMFSIVLGAVAGVAVFILTLFNTLDFSSGAGGSSGFSTGSGSGSGSSGWSGGGGSFGGGGSSGSW